MENNTSQSLKPKKMKLDFKSLKFLESTKFQGVNRCAIIDEDHKS